MDIFLDDKSSLFMLRSVARGSADLALVPSSEMTPRMPTAPRCTLTSLGIPQLLGCMRVPEQNVLGIVVPEGKCRVRAKHIECRVWAHPRGETPFQLLSSLDPEKPSGLLPTNGRVFVMSPENVVLGMAARLKKRVLHSHMDAMRATLMLLKLCLELCGTYSHDPLKPLDGQVRYNTLPLTNAKRLRSCFEPVGRECGLSLARKVAAMTYDLSGSPQESFMGPALFFADSLGGLALTEFEANKTLDLSTAEHASIGYRTITPDFTMSAIRSVVEYLGEVHNQGDNPRIDHQRSLDYQTLGYREFGFWYKDVCTRKALMVNAERIVAVLEQYGDHDVRSRFGRLARSAPFEGRQRVLFEVFRPWLR